MQTYEFISIFFFSTFFFDFERAFDFDLDLVFFLTAFLGDFDRPLAWVTFFSTMSLSMESGLSNFDFKKTNEYVPVARVIKEYSFAICAVVVKLISWSSTLLYKCGTSVELFFGQND